MSKRYGIYKYGVNAYSAAANVAGEVISDIVFDAVPFASVRHAAAAISTMEFATVPFGSVSCGGRYTSVVRVDTYLERATAVSFAAVATTDVRFSTFAEGRLRINHTVEMNFDIKVESEYTGNVFFGAAATSEITVDNLFDPYESKFWEPKPSSGSWLPTSSPTDIWVVQPTPTPWG